VGDFEAIFCDAYAAGHEVRCSLEHLRGLNLHFAEALGFELSSHD